MFNLSKGKIDPVYAPLQAQPKIEYDGELDKYLGVDLDCHTDISNINSFKSAFPLPKYH